MELKTLKDLHDKAFNHGQVPREQAADDTLFYWVTQWSDALLGESQLQYRGEFDILRKAGRQIMADLKANPVSIDFEPKAESRQDGAELLDGLYRSDERNNQTIESYNNASNESVVCGVGAWMLYTDYQSTRGGDNNQVIRRKPIYEANNKCFWDPNAKLADKSDASYVSVLYAYSEDGYIDLVKDLTGEDVEGIGPSFSHPEESYVFPWFGEDAKVYVVEFYHREKVKDKILTMVDPFGQPTLLRESDLSEVMDEMIDAGYKIEDEKVIERWQVTKYIASGNEILSEEVIAGEHIPVVPVYGERAFVEDEEYYEGVTRLAKDPQRLRNFQMSYLADIVSRSPRPKPIFNPEQIQGFEHMYEESGADNNYPYLLQNRLTAAGEPLPIGPVAQMPEQQMPQALIASIQLSREAVADVANPGLPQDIADPDLSGKAVYALQNRIDQQSMVYQENLKHAKRRDAEIYASMAVEIYDAPRKVTLTKPDGQRETVQVMEIVIDNETGEPVALNDITNMEFEVFADISPSYTTQKQQTREELIQLMSMMGDGDPMRSALMLKYVAMMDGNEFDDVRDYANKQLLLTGIKEPETEEEIAIVQQAQEAAQGQQDPNMVLALAEDKKGQAALMEAQRKQIETQAKIQNDQAGTQIDVFKAQTDRAKMQVDAQKVGAEINYKNIEAFGKQLENAAKASAFRASVSPQRILQ